MDKQPWSPQHPPVKKAPDAAALATASFITGILSLIAFCFYPFAILLGTTSIILAIFSRREKPLQGMAIAGIALSLTGVIASVVIIMASFTLQSSPEYNQMMQEYFKINESTVESTE